MVSHFAVLPRFPDRALEGVDDVNSGLDCPGVVRKCVGFGSHAWKQVWVQCHISSMLFHGQICNKK